MLIFLYEKLFQIALVGQEPVLYAKSIEENIAYGLANGTWTHEDVVDVAKMANAHQFVLDLTDQYKTEAGEKGVQLSGGQKQRVKNCNKKIAKFCRNFSFLFNFD